LTIDARCLRSGRLNSTEYGIGFWFPSRRSLHALSTSSLIHQHLDIHSHVHRQLGQVEGGRKVEGFHRERCGSCLLSAAMCLYHLGITVASVSRGEADVHSQRRQARGQGYAGERWHVLPCLADARVREGAKGRPRPAPPSIPHITTILTPCHSLPLLRAGLKWRV
jgi:hypothetical protein